MADSKKKLIGRLVKCFEVGKNPSDIVFPEDDDIFLLKEENLSENINFYDSSKHLLASDHIDYPGETVAAVFGEDYEAVVTYIEKIENLGPSSNIEIYPMEEMVNSCTWSKGKDEVGEGTELKTFKSSFSMYRHSTASLRDAKVRAWEQGGKLHIELPTQWPLAVKRAVSKYTGLPFEKIIYHFVEFEAKNDEYLSKPTQMAILASLACRRTGCECELVSSVRSYQPGLEFNIETTLDDNFNLHTINVKAVADLGAHPRLTDEYMNSLIGGFVPVYDFKEINIALEIYKSKNPPACFYSDMGYSLASSAMENHISNMCNEFGINPSLWRKNNFKKTTISKKVRKSSVFDKLPQTLERVLKDSWFDRQYVVNNHTRITSHGVNPFTNYSRGIGLACSEGVAGFTTDFKHLEDFSVTVSIDEKDHVTISSGIIPGAFTEKVIRDTVEGKLGTDDVDFLDINDPNIHDIGPAVLSRKSTFLPMIIGICCDKLADIDERPCIVSNTLDDNVKFESALYEANTCGTLAISLHIDPVALVPVIDKVWCNISIGKVYDSKRFETKVKQRIASTINEMCPAATNTHSIDFEFKEVENVETGSASIMIKALTTSAFITALSQALNYNVTRLPIREKDIFGIIKKNKAPVELNTLMKEEDSNEA